MNTRERVRSLALENGFDVMGVAAPELTSHVQGGLRQFLDQQHHGDMEWMETNAARRASPKDIWPEVKSVIVLGENYAPQSDPLARLSQRDIGNISVYAQGDDYHDVIKKKLKALARAIAEQFGCDVKVFVDTAPVMEKPLAEQAGLGWQGKHTCLVSREFGSWLFLGEIFTTLPIQPDMPETDHCGSCTSCIDICPTHAFEGPRRLDARKCISYLTIEHKGHIAPEFREAIGNRIYGCDDCLAVCPWNKFAQTARETAYQARDELKSPALSYLLTLNEAGFRALFRKSPVKRIGRDRFLRNVLIAAGNSGNASYADQVRRLLTDPSELVRAMAIWAAAKLASRDEYSRMKAEHKPREGNPEVAAEWKEESYG